MPDKWDMSDRSEEVFKDFTAKSLRELDARLGSLESGLAQNTAITKDIAALLELGKGFFKACNFIGRAVIWLTGLTVGAILLWKVIIVNVKDFIK